MIIIACFLAQSSAENFEKDRSRVTDRNFLTGKEDKYLSTVGTNLVNLWMAKTKAKFLGLGQLCKFVIKCKNIYRIGSVYRSECQNSVEINWKSLIPSTIL